MSDLWGNIIILSALFILGPLFYLKRIRTSENWQATVTPLASIIGSGFLVSAPLVVLTTGKWAAIAMLAIVIIAYFIGSVMRFNIQYLEPYLIKDGRSKLIIPLEVVSHPTLGVAYMISVAFYLKLLSVFTMKGFGIHSDFAENTLTTGVLIFIALIGWFKGLHVLEVLEKYAVNLKLAIIGSLVIGFYAYNIFEFEHDLWFIAEHNHFSVWESFRKLLGILIIVQGFETSRYMGALYTAETRVKTMRYAQIISGFIYVTFVLSAIILFNDVHTISETAVIDLCKLIAPILPPLLIVAAIMSQFSAAVADSIGSSGLISEGSFPFLVVGFLSVPFKAP